MCFTRSTITPVVEVLDHYNVVPEFIPPDVTEANVKSISGKLTSAAGPGGINATSLQQWFLRFSIASQHLRRTVSSLA